MNKSKKGVSGFLKKLFSITTVYGHCDIPCGIYDPHMAQEAALTVIRMMDLLKDNENQQDLVRYVLVKEEHARKCKNEIGIIYGDYFKEGHFAKYPNLHDLNHRVMELASQAKQGKDGKIGRELLEVINEISEIFWSSKEISTKRVKAPYSVQEEIVIPKL